MTIRRVAAKPAGIVLVCGKCAKRSGHKDRLTKPLKRALKPLKLRVLSSKCLGPCPGRATTVHDSRRPREWLIVKDGTPVEEVAALLVEAVG